ncbi:MAG: hypothetical protein LUI87_01540, partial [Lachnospiraceae bacterium]|nr:hypothetical protein [Lachnospiraceae bacterium]
KNGKFVCRMYGVEDNPKENKLFGRDICNILKDPESAVNGEGGAASCSLWTAKLYPVCDTVEEAVKATLALGLAEGAGIADGSGLADEMAETCPAETGRAKTGMVKTGMAETSLREVDAAGTDMPETIVAKTGMAEAGLAETDRDLAAPELLSLKDSFNLADVTAILPWQENLYEQVVAEAILENIENGVPAEKVAKTYPDIDRHTVEYLLNRAKKQNIDKLDEFSRLIRIYSYLWKITDENKYNDLCFGTICDATLAAAMESVQFTEYHLKQDVVVNLPVRVNWGGGWSDTPPYCMENGGTVLNAAISLNGRLPIEATVKRLDKPVIALASTDIGSYKEFDSLAQLQDCRNPSDPFALHKAALIACGVIPVGKNVAGEEIADEKTVNEKIAGNEPLFSIADLCERLGGGMYMNTRVIDIPKGSGLGTSSILAGACVKALLQAMGQEPSDEEVFERVLCMEQLMSTGGGWQDQVGGIVPGIKMVTTRPGLSQKIICTPLAVSKETVAELNDRFALIYTGQRRLARNLLRDVVGKYVCNDETSIKAHDAIQRLAVLMRYELEKDNVDGFAQLLTEHWQESQRIDAGSTNTCIDQIFTVIDDLVDGRMICGAGGGGFLQVVLKKSVTKDDLRERLNEVFQDSGVAVWECAFV